MKKDVVTTHCKIWEKKPENYFGMPHEGVGGGTGKVVSWCVVL